MGIFLLIILIISLIPQYRILNPSLSAGNQEKLRAFECGFNIIDKNYQGFSITFLKVAILFLLVDLEIALLIPIFNKRGILLKSLTRLIKCIGVISLFLVGLLLVEKLSGSLS